MPRIAGDRPSLEHADREKSGYGQIGQFCNEFKSDYEASEITPNGG